MTRHRLTDNIYLDEVVHPSIYSARGEKSIELLDMRIIVGAQSIRDIIDRPMIFNNWWDGGKLQNRGLRPFDAAVGAKFSQHKYGRAVDFHVPGMTIAQIHEVIMAHENQLLGAGLITTIEDKRDTPTWVHIDCRHTCLDRLLVVRG